MGYLDEVNSIIRNTSKYAKDVKTGFMGKRKSGTSIAKGALNGTLQFPCLVSDAIPIDMASTLAKTFERVYASFLQSYLSLNNTIDISVDRNPSDFLKKIHKNIKLESTELDIYTENFIEPDAEFDALMERIYNGTTKAYINENTKEMIVFNFSDKLSRDVFESHKELLEESLKGIDFDPFPNIGNSPFYEAIPVSSYNPDDPLVVYRDPVTGRLVDANLDIRRAIDDENRANDRAEWNRQSGINIATNAIGSLINTGLGIGRDIVGYNLNQRAADKAYQRDLAKADIAYKRDMDKKKFDLMNGDKLRVPTLLSDNDCKKANEMQPYLMQVRLMAVNDQNEFVQFMDFIVGIKVVLHNIKSDEMIVNIQKIMQNNNKFFNFIRWTTGEKAFFKDLLFDIKGMKLDVANRSRGASPWWTTLKRLKDRSNYMGALFNRTQVVPNSTMIVTDYEVSAVRDDFGIDLRNPRFALKLMGSLFLMNFVIVNNDTRTVEILYDGERAYQTYALETLEREVTMNSNKVGRELTRMISR